MKMKKRVTTFMESIDEVKIQVNGSVFMQVIAGIVVSMQAGQCGIINGWASPNNLLLQSDKTPLPHKISIEESAWITSIVAFGGFFGTLLVGFIANRFGRKWPFISLTIPITISWLLILFAQNVYMLYGARLIQGAVNIAIFSLCQLYFVEIADDRIRGALCGTLALSGHIGVVISFALGAYSTYISYPILAIALSILFDVVFVFFPETPIFLLKQNKIAEAEKSIRFYKNMRSSNVDKKLIDIEIERLRSTLNDSDHVKSQKNAFKWIDIIKNPGRKAMIIGIVLAALTHITGSYALLNYTATIFKESGSIISPNESALVVAVIQLIGTFVVPILVDRSGRKILYIISTLGAALGFGVLGLYMMLKSWDYAVESFNWIPITSFSYVVFVQSLGVSTLSYTVIAEIMPESLKELGISVSNIVLCAFTFLILKFMPTLSAALGFHFTMFLFGAISIPCGLFIIFYVPETKGKSYQEIQESLK